MSNIIEDGDNHQFSVGDVLYSPSGMFFGTLESSGNFNIYVGDGPGDGSKHLFWSTESSSNLRPGWQVSSMKLRKGPFSNNIKNLQIFAHSTHLEQIWCSGGSSDLDTSATASIGDDGKFSLLQNNNIVWQSGKSALLQSIESNSIAYDISNAKKILSKTFVVSIPKAENKTDVQQTQPIGTTYQETKTKSFSNQFGIKASIKTNFKTGIPFIAEGKIEVGAETSFQYTWGETISEGKTIPVNLSVNVPAHKIYRASLSVTVWDIEVPYMMDAVLVFTDGTRVPRTIRGVYKGSISLEGSVTWEDITPGQIAATLSSVEYRRS